MDEMSIMPLNDDQPKHSAWLDATALISAVAALAFLLSWAYIDSISRGLSFSCGEYFEPVDYVQITPAWVPGVVLLVVFLSVLFGLPALVKNVSSGYLWLVVLIIIGFSLLWAELQGSFTVKHLLEHTPVSKIFRKGEKTAIQGKLVFSLKRYLLFLGEDDSVIAISQAEVQMIQTPRKKLLTSTTPPPTSNPTVSPSPGKP